MRRNRGWHRLESALVLLILGSGFTSAQADPITIPGYTATDLGAGTPTFSTDANGNGVLNAPNGQVYAFSQTANTVLPSGPGVAASIPLLCSAPVNNPEVNGNPQNAFAYIQSAAMNANGIVTAVEDWGVSGHFEFSSAYFVQANANGSWSVPVGIWNGNIVETGALLQGFYYGNVVAGANNLNQILGAMGIGSLYNLSDVVLYNVNSRTLTNITTLFTSASGGVYQSGGGYEINQPIALDADGRILLSATEFNPNVGFSPSDQTTLLLTPDGLSAAPLEVPAPEPGAVAVALLAIAGFVAHRLREHSRER